MKDNLEARLALIEKRNKRVEQDKQWETSWTRRISVAIITYILVTIYLEFIGNAKPYTSALVPSMGYLLSTLILKNVRKIWQK